MVDLKKDSWFYALIAAILAIIGVLVPWGSLEVMGITIYSWLGGMIGYYSGGGYDDWMGGNALNIWTLGLTMFSIAILLVYSINTWKGKEFKWDWLMYILTGIVLLIFPILTMVLEGVEDAFPIGGIFIIISGVLAITAFVIDKFIGRE
ncbi:MAG: hypothetical protein KAV01_00410 [Candidatus Lokiarchaeota archaeon]|nr:hypothetical protein [Candidatus Lokiarchaeota archaeon]